MAAVDTFQFPPQPYFTFTNKDVGKSTFDLSGSSGSTPSLYFKMRCRDSGLAPPGYVIWVVTGAPDDDASEATLVGVASDIAVMGSWQA